ncbi:MAG: GtrA family protein [Actinobacteria bacterium]|nr:GtrA family protein [Actinomycetota bacterium]
MEKIRGLSSKYLVQKTDAISIQFFRYLFVGGGAALINLVSLYVLTSKLGVYYLLSAAIAFILGIVTNYVLSIAWVFRSTGQVKKEIVLFLLIGATGLFLNEAIMYMLVSVLTLFYLGAWLIATAAIMIWNFGMRRKFVFD